MVKLININNTISEFQIFLDLLRAFFRISLFLVFPVSPFKVNVWNALAKDNFLPRFKIIWLLTCLSGAKYDQRANLAVGKWASEGVSLTPDGSISVFLHECPPESRKVRLPKKYSRKYLEPDICKQPQTVSFPQFRWKVFWVDFIILHEIHCGNIT